MRGRALQERAERRAMSLKGARLAHPFGPDWDVYRVAGRMFMFLTCRTGRPIVVLKADPQEAAALCEQYPDVTPGYHMNKRHWITLAPDGPLTADEVDELVTESYRLVVQKLPKAERPVDPATLGPAP